MFPLADKGGITQARIDEELKSEVGFDWISAVAISENVPYKKPEELEFKIYSFKMDLMLQHRYVNRTRKRN
jgi:hypothetical protein